MKSSRRFVVFGGALMVLVGLAETGHAAAAPPRVGILRFVGAGETEVRGAVTWLVGKQGFSLIGARALEQAEETSGQQLTTKEGIKAVAEELTLATIIDGRVEVHGGLATARIALRDPKDGTVFANEVWTVKKGGTKALSKLLVATFWQRLGPQMEDLTGVTIKQPRHNRRARHRHS